jgi:hypothetical protein
MRQSLAQYCRHETDLNDVVVVVVWHGGAGVDACTSIGGEGTRID